MLIYLLFIALMTAVFPIVGLLCSIPLYFAAKTKRTVILSSVLLGVLVGVISMFFVPETGFDLTRHQDVVQFYSHHVDGIGGFFKAIPSIKMELIPQTLSFIVSRLGNVNLLQFITTFIGYSAIFYILADYKRTVNLKNRFFIPIFILMLFGQSTLYYFSGLYNYLAINIFALAFYLDYTKQRKIPAYILYATMPFLHESMLLPLAIVLIYKLCGNKLNTRFVILSLTAAVFSTFVLSFLVDYVGLSFLSQVRVTLDAYIVKNEHMHTFYQGFGLVLDIIKIGLALLCCGFQKKVAENQKARHFIMVFSVLVIIMMFNMIAIVRFASLILFMSAPLMMNIFATKDTKNIRLLHIAFSVLALVFAGYNIHSIHWYGYQELPPSTLVMTWPEVLEHGK